MLNTNAAIERLMNKVAIYKTICEMYLNSVDDEFNELIAIIEQGDLDAIAKKAHSIRGRSLEIGAEPLAALLDKIEKSSKAGESIEPLSTIEEIKSCKTATVDAITQFLSQC